MKESATPKSLAVMNGVEALLPTLQLLDLT